MDEPSVLDYLKAKLTFWKKSNFELARGGEEVQPREEYPVSAGEEKQETRPILLGLPWPILLPVGLALVAQFFLEPPNRSGLPAALFYGAAALAGGIAAWKGWLSLAEGQPEVTVLDHLNYRRTAALTGFLGLMASFLLFGHNRFNPINLTVWLYSLGALVVAFAQPLPVPDWKALGQRLQLWLKNPAIALRLSGWGALLVVVALVLAYFRFYDLNRLPMNMVSDHAEKLLDVGDVLHGQFKIFFERNTGREAFQFYWTALMALIFKTGISFLSLKIGTVIVGVVTLIYIFRLGHELGGKWVALYALFFAGIAYWPNIISRIGLRFPLYPFCVAPVMYYLLRGLRRGYRNDFIWAGLWLGLGLHGYTASRIVPALVIVAVVLYSIHSQSAGRRRQALVWGAIVLFIAFAVFIPLFRYALENPQMFNYRSLTRVADIEHPLPGNPVNIFFSNTWNALRMFFWSNGDVWVHSIPYRPALDVITAALFFLGLVLLLVRYLQKRHWRDLFLLLSIPVLLLPSILSLAFPNENPNLNRTAGAYVPVFLIVALGFDALVRSLYNRVLSRQGKRAVILTGVVLAVATVSTNYQLFFVEYRKNFDQSAWNTAEMGEVMRAFTHSVGTPESVYVVGYPYWVDTRLVAINAGYPEINPELMPEQIPTTRVNPGAKMFMVNPADEQAIALLKEIYPEGWMRRYSSEVQGKDFLLFFVPAMEDSLP
ncbi:MAG TPA: hypothetical protein DEQ80_00515 [Anaerolinea thermolimosa]|uniref:Glycosyltransferase RgtA/B/C/D-like domain-containing protein n=1 Tax=Anaerolinea thermolimosa TaxID=229919 RepID=A0A3D1JFD8_9CHLR|nr:glycosyltransferase family 39 protein [Anaerolinea thermolimosa]GAP05736.1 4-amino-4-deoxy-L-arabinose transferase [Anaerolinea thermolimosa]HCE16316.1 hypothetical protein [Anaerolinea thermolimosa]